MRWVLFDAELCLQVTNQTEDDTFPLAIPRSGRRDGFSPVPTCCYSPGSEETAVGSLNMAEAGNDIYCGTRRPVLSGAVPASVAGTATPLPGSLIGTGLAACSRFL